MGSVLSDIGLNQAGAVELLASTSAIAIQRPEHNGFEALGPGPIVVHFAAGSVATFDFGSELPGRFEVGVDGDIPAGVVVGVSEYLGPMLVNVEALEPQKWATVAAGGSMLTVKFSGGHEGFRFGWVRWPVAATVTFASPRALVEPRTAAITGFAGAPAEDLQIWRAGVHTLLNHLRGDHVGAVLVDRGDRFAWALDYYCAQRTLLDVFGDVDLARSSVGALRGQNHGIYSYSLYWVLSVADIYDFTGDTADLSDYLDECIAISMRALDDFQEFPPLHFVGWDERLGAGFEDPNRQEAQCYVQALAIQVARVVARCCWSAGRAQLAEALGAKADQRATELSGAVLGVPATAAAVLAGVNLDGDKREWFTESAESCSPPSQLVILEALQRIELTERALWLARRMWGSQLRQGQTNFGECFRPYWLRDLRTNERPPFGPHGVTSLSHAWGSVYQVQGWYLG